MINQKENIIKGIMGFIVGDAMGVPLEFTNRRDEKNKVVDMLEYGTYNLPKGYWSDDSSMVIATMQSIIDNQGKINYSDMMNKFVSWAYKNEFTPNNKTFDIGNTTQMALRNYSYKEEFEIYKDPLMCGGDSLGDNGNGSLMRIFPVAYYCYYKNLEEEEIYNLIKDISSLTHKHNISILGCYIYVLLVISLLNGNDKKVAYGDIKKYDYGKYFDQEIISYYNRILKGDISLLSMEEINSSGYIVDTLEAVIWCFMNNSSYDHCVITAINLGDDTDTIGALVGGISGIYFNDINKEWINDLARKDYLVNLCSDFYTTLVSENK